MQRTDHTPQLAKIAIGVVLCATLGASSRADDRTYTMARTNLPTKDASPEAQADAFLSGQRLAGMSKTEAEANRASLINQFKANDAGFTVKGKVEINCGNWGSEVTSFTGIVSPTPSPLYSTELFTDGTTFVLNKARTLATIKGYDRRDYCGRAVERYVLAGYLEPNTKLLSSKTDAKSGTQTLTYQYQSITPNFYKEQFSVSETLGISPKIKSAVSYYVTPIGQKILDTKITVLAYKAIDDHEYPGTIRVSHYAAKKPTETLLFNLVSSSPSVPVTLSEFLPKHVHVMDNRLGYGKAVNYLWSGSLPTKQKLESEQSFAIFSDNSKLPIIIFGIGVVAIGFGYFLKRKGAKTTPA